MPLLVINMHVYRTGIRFFLLIRTHIHNEGQRYVQIEFLFSVMCQVQLE